MTTKVIQERTGGFTKGKAPIERLQIRKILCPVDFSEYSRHGLSYGISLARHFGSKLIIQHTVQPSYRVLTGLEPNLGESDIGTQLQSARDEIRRMLIAMGIDTSEVTVLLETGGVTARVLETVTKERIDLVVMGTHGHSGFHPAVLGLVAEELVQQAICPVLVARRPRHGFADSDLREPLKTILLATDFSPHSDRALAHALKWSCEWGARLVLFHGVQETAPAMKGREDLFPEYSPYFERQLASAWEIIRHIVPDPVRESCEVSNEVRRGNPKEEILRVAEERGADLIITGARGASSSGVPWGSVSSAVVRDGRIPVLVVRELAA